MQTKTPNFIAAALLRYQADTKNETAQREREARTRQETACGILEQKLEWSKGAITQPVKNALTSAYRATYNRRGQMRTGLLETHEDIFARLASQVGISRLHELAYDK